MKKSSEKSPRLFLAPNPKSRPVHKEALLEAKAQNEFNRQHPEPMSLMRKREKSGEIPAQFHGRPEVTRGKIEAAASAMAAWDNSDPFAYGRTALHVAQGFLNSDDIVKEMGQQTMARQAAKRKEIDDAKSHA